MQLDIFNEAKEVIKVTKEQYANIDRLIKSNNIDLAYHMMIGFQISLQDIVKRIVRLNFVSFIDGWNGYERNGIHFFCRFRIFGKDIDFYESGGSGVFLAINDNEIGVSMYIGVMDTYENPLRQKMIRNFTNTIIKNWKSITDGKANI